MTNGDTTLVRVDEASQVGEARRTARRLAGELGLGEVVAERAAIVASEAARNLVAHGGGGVVGLQPLGHPPRGLGIVALDRGRGIEDLGRAMRDGHSTAGTPGEGLGAMARVGTEFDLWSAPGQGTVLVAEVWSEEPSSRKLASGAISVAKTGERVCGDGWLVVEDAGRAVLAVVDGLGHGPLAADAARAALDAIRRAADQPPREIVGAAHAALRATRGAALAIAALDLESGALRYAGLGNVVGAILGAGAARRLVSLAGTAGHAARTIQEFSYDLPEGAVLVMHSDGIATHWDAAAYPGLLSRHPALLAGVLFRDHARGRDDATVLVARRGA
ncbi:SpoIIE family protein phosphatase [Anaeromyxobacter terrae]|uniref:SpoIIE family protein phosphatase n=1 Tax=Anaeromyxobacter terrae TaxID=2925406 RepID=UPI001F5A2BB0|nr:SpoIIE family protein phosphatase [Anaeromyxobacter sp. SG22]